MIQSIPANSQGPFPEHFKFSTNDVISCIFARRKRRAELYKAVSLGSICDQKVTLLIEGETSCQWLTVRAMAIGMSTLFVERTQGIPIHCIKEVHLQPRS